MTEFNVGDTIYVVDEDDWIWEYRIKELRHILVMGEDSHLKWQTLYGCLWRFSDKVIEIDRDRHIFPTEQEALDWLAKHKEKS